MWSSDVVGLMKELDVDDLGTLVFTHNLLTGARIGGAVCIYFADEEEIQSKSRQHNRVVDIAASFKNNMTVRQWKGPVVAVKRDGHIDMATYSDLIACFIAHGNPGGAERFGGPKIPGVKLLCDGAMRARSGPRAAIPVAVPRLHPVFQDPGIESEISRVRKHLPRILPR